jgi:hypothetical protein
MESSCSSLSVEVGFVEDETCGALSIVWECIGTSSNRKRRAMSRCLILDIGAGTLDILTTAQRANSTTSGGEITDFSHGRKTRVFSEISWSREERWEEALFQRF